MHFTDLGMIAQLLALIFAVYALVASALGARRRQPALIASGRRAVLMVALFAVMACIALVASFVTRDFGASYVAAHSSRAMPWYYTAAAFYSGQEGSLLYWCTMLALFSALAVVLHRRAPADVDHQPVLRPPRPELEERRETGHDEAGEKGARSQVADHCV
ncbi:MAG: hypothetical protein ACHQ4H_15710 [Ktedonobacterales bacterium]